MERRDRQRRKESERDANFLNHEFAQFLQQFTGMDIHDPTQHDAFLGCADALKRHIERYQVFVRLKQKMLTTDLSVFSLGTLLKDLVTSQEENFASKGKIILEIPTGEIYICGDLGKLKLVLEELLANAMKYTQQGDITVSCGKVVGDLPSWEISIQDPGTGMDPEILAFILGQKASEDASDTRQFASGGIGLWMCQSFLELMGGRLVGTSEKGKGTTMRISVLEGSAESRLLVASERPSRAPSLSRRSSSSDSGPSSVAAACPPVVEEINPPPEEIFSILIVDDMLINRVVLEKQVTQELRERKVHIEFAVDGEDAVQKVQARPFHLIFMDIQMPKKDGLDATREIRQYLAAHPEQTRPRIVAFTANMADEETCRKAGMDEFLVKPVRGNRLKKTLSGLFELPKNA